MAPLNLEILLRVPSVPAKGAEETTRSAISIQFLYIFILGYCSRRRSHLSKTAPAQRLLPTFQCDDFESTKSRASLLLSRLISQHPTKAALAAKWNILPQIEYSKYLKGAIEMPRRCGERERGWKHHKSNRKRKIFFIVKFQHTQSCMKKNNPYHKAHKEAIWECM